MIVRMLGTTPLARLMSGRPGADEDDSWLLFGPTRPEVVHDAPRRPAVEAPLRWAAE